MKGSAVFKVCKASGNTCSIFLKDYIRIAWCAYSIDTSGRFPFWSLSRCFACACVRAVVESKTQKAIASVVGSRMFKKT